MRMKMRPRYYCDHCKKAGGSAGHMKRHEASCTGNPARICRMHDATGANPLPLAELVALIPTIGVFHTGSEYHEDYRSLDDAALKVLREKADGCPVCMFAALRQAGAFAQSFNGTTMKEECKALWADMQEERECRRYM
jgi:hypothetical protein